MENWCWIPILLTLEHVEVGVIATNIIAMFLKCIIKYEKNLNQNLCLMLVCFGCDGDYVFQGCHNWVTSQLFIIVLFLIDVHCMAHQTNLLVVVLSKLPLVSCIESMLQSFYLFSFIALKSFLNL
jgi:hypothetical protein